MGGAFLFFELATVEHIKNNWTKNLAPAGNLKVPHKETKQLNEILMTLATLSKRHKLRNPSLSQSSLLDRDVPEFCALISLSNGPLPKFSKIAT